MVMLTRNKKPLAERPLKTSQATGASLATMGFANSIPLMHGSQGCGAFAKVFLIQHFREPMPIQNTAVDQISAVMGSDDNIKQALALLAEKHAPEIVTVLSTGLTEMQGSDMARAVAEYQQENTDNSQTSIEQIVPVPCPDFVGSLQTGFANTLDAIIKNTLTDTLVNKRNYDQINILCSSALTPADADLLKYYAEQFNLTLIIAPDLATSLDGHLDDADFSPTSSGGTTLQDLKQMPFSAATLCVGESVYKTGSWLEQTFEMPCHYFAHLMGLEQTDAFIQLLSDISGRPIPLRLLRERKRLQDTLLDTHFVLSTEAIGVAQEPDNALGFAALLSEAGCRIPLIVTTAHSEQLLNSAAEKIIIGDHSDLDSAQNELRCIIGNTHCAEFAEPSIPVLRAGYPCHDRYGNADSRWIGYEGARACLNELANLVSGHAVPEVPAYVSPYAFSADDLQEAEQ